MTVQNTQRRVLNYRPCRYGSSRVDFRGPKKKMDGGFIAFLGGSETYGKFIPKPFPELVEDKLGVPCINFGVMNAGIDVFLNEPEILSFAGRAEVTVIQILGAQNMSNRFYRVHPRRNDRFIAASTLMRSVFHDVDFSEFNFTKHMLHGVSNRAVERFSFVREELRSAWCARMRDLLDRIPGKKVLMWFSDHPPPLKQPSNRLGREPMFVDQRMIDSLRTHIDALAQIGVSQSALKAGTSGMVLRDRDQPIAQQMLGPFAHAEAASGLVSILKPILQCEKKKARL